MKKQTLFIAFMAISVSLVIWACSKSKSAFSLQNKAQGLKTIGGKLDFSCNEPNVEDGILTFTDVRQYQCYYDFLTNALDDDTTGMDADSALLSLETSFGYTSIRSVALANFEELNRIGWPTSEEIPDEDWIASRVERSILNTNREVKIGNIIQKYLSPRYLVEVDAEQGELLNRLRKLSENPTAEDIIALDPTRAYLFIASMQNVDEFYPTGEKPIGTNPGGGIDPSQQSPTAGWRMNGSTYEGNRCNTPGLITFGGFVTTRNWTPQQCSYHIDYGDGTASGTSNDPDKVSTFGTNQSIVAPFTHQYAQGTYTATVSIRSISPINSGSTVMLVKTYPIIIGPPPATCTKDFKYLQSLTHINSNTDLKGAIRFETWRTGLFGYPRTKVSGWTELHQQDANGYWNRVKNKKTHLVVKLGWNTADEDCNDLGNGGGVLNDYSGTAEKSGKNTNRFLLESSPPAYNGDVLRIKQLYGTHSFWIENGISGSFNHSIIICQ